VVVPLHYNKAGSPTIINYQTFKSDVNVFADLDTYQFSNEPLSTIPPTAFSPSLSDPLKLPFNYIFASIWQNILYSKLLTPSNNFLACGGKDLSTQCFPGLFVFCPVLYLLYIFFAVPMLYVL